MSGNRWRVEDVQGVIGAAPPQALIDLWDAVPPGFDLPADAVQSIVRGNQRAITEDLALLQQQVIASVGLSAGFRPEQFALLRDLPGVDIVAETAWLAITGQLDAASAKDLVVEILKEVGVSVQAPAAFAAYAPAVGAVVQVVWQMVSTIVRWERLNAESDAAFEESAQECAPPAYSAIADRDLLQDGKAILLGSNWDDIFLPLVRPYDPEAPKWQDGTDAGFLGFTCCISPVDRARVIAPVGTGIGNRGQSGYFAGSGQYGDWFPPVYGSGLGLGCLPMCPDSLVHRAIVVPGASAGGAAFTYDPAGSLPQVGAFGTYVWHLLWSRGPACFSVDGDLIADAWAEYLGFMRRQIGGNERGFGDLGKGICDDWPAANRQAALAWFFAKLGVPASAANPEGIYTFADAAPVREWRRFADLQRSLLWRPVVAYVDATTCHPNWRERVASAQEMLLEHPSAVCFLDEDSIHDLEYRARVVAARAKKGAGVCYSRGTSVAAPGVTATEGPSLDPLSSDAPPMPSFPVPARPVPGRPDITRGRVPQRSSKTTAVVVGALGLGGGLALLRSLRR